jgi:hypothetical protein
LYLHFPDTPRRFVWCMVGPCHGIVRPPVRRGKTDVRHGRWMRIWQTSNRG